MGRKPKRGVKRANPEDEKLPEGSDVEAKEDVTTGLPMANIVRLMRQVIPTHVKISARAKQLTHDCAVEFVGFVGGEASERARSQHRRTIAPEDFTWSFHALGFDNYVHPMRTYIRRYREYQNAGGASSLAPRPPPPAAAAVITPRGDVPCFTDEEVQFLRSVVPPPYSGYDGAESSSAHAPAAGHGDGYGGGM
ncbi:hypothetical protein ACP70R_026302 [Stipagrostis hirtigluma subsp. patula]